MKNFRLCIFVVGGLTVMRPGASEALSAARETKPSVTARENEKPHASSQRLVGTWPPKTPRVSVNQRKGTVAQALRSIAKQAGWDLMLTAPAKLTERPITMQVRNRPAALVLELILTQSQLKAELKNKLLVVTPFTGPATAEEKDAWIRFDDPKKAGVLVKGAGAQAKGAVHRPAKGEPRARADRADAMSEPPEDRTEEPERRGRRRRKHGKRDRVVVGHSLRIDKGEEADTAVAIGGSVTVLGVVHGEAVAVGGSVILEPGGVVNGDAVALGGKIEVKEGAELHGDRVAIGGSLKGVVTFISGLATGSVAWFMHSIVGTFVRSVLLLILALMIITFMPQRLERIRQYLAERPGASILGGVGLAIGFIPGCVLLAITIVGLVLIPFAVLALVAVHVIGLTAFMVWMGYKIPLFESGKTPIVAMLMGLVIITLIDLIPVAGSLIVAAIAFISAGAVLLSQVGKPSEPKAEQVAEASAA